MTPERTLALVGTAGLLVVAIVIAIMVIGGGKSSGPSPVAAVTPVPALSPTPTPTAKPTPPPLTTEQRAERQQALQYLQGQGFDAASLRSYRGDQTLRVLLARPIGAQQGAERAFFFVGANFVGTDAPQASGDVRILRTTDTTVTLRYGLFKPGDGVCCPTGGHAKVRFHWDGSGLRVLDVLPPPQQRLPGAG